MCFSCYIALPHNVGCKPFLSCASSATITVEHCARRVEQLHIPCDLKLTLFIGGGVEDGAQAPHLTFIPIPLLSKVTCTQAPVAASLAVLLVVHCCTCYKESSVLD